MAGPGIVPSVCRVLLVLGPMNEDASRLNLFEFDTATECEPDFWLIGFNDRN